MSKSLTKKALAEKKQQRLQDEAIEKQKQIALLAAKQKQISLKKKELIEGLPHLYGFPHYAWSRAFFESKNKVNLLTAANQISKSSTQIRKCIHWATEDKLWPELWRTRPAQFWYLYPSKELFTTEFKHKWMPEFLPRGKFASDAKYGWRAVWEKKDAIISAIEFNSGVTVYFKSYKQDPSILQASTVHAIFCDEELPESLWPELTMRLEAPAGYFHAVFTATIGQEFWQRAMEGKKGTELLPDAFKQQVSMYDCLSYEDGSPSPWTLERIKEREAKCRSQYEVDVRVHGKFGSSEARKYSAYDPGVNYITPVAIPSTWARYSAVDYGTGGEKNHPAAICFVAVNPEKTLGYVYDGWRGDNIVTTSADILDKYREMRGGQQIVLQMYDQSARDFGTIAERQGETFMKSEKSHEIGEDVINTLFKNKALFIFDTYELSKLSSELVSLQKLTVKSAAKDDLCDALRYCVTKIPWNFDAISKVSEKNADQSAKPGRNFSKEELVAWEIDQRRGIFAKKTQVHEATWSDVQYEVDMWNDEYGNG